MANEFVTRRGIISLGGITFPYYSTTTAYTVTADDYFIDCSGTFSVFLPNTDDSLVGKIFIVKNSGLGVITVDPFGTQTIDGSPTKTLVSNESISVIRSGGSTWISFFGGNSNSGNGTSGTSGYSGLDGTGGSGSGNDGSNNGRWELTTGGPPTFTDPGEEGFITNSFTASTITNFSISSVSSGAQQSRDYIQWLNALIAVKNAGNTVYLQLHFSSRPDANGFPIYDQVGTPVLGIWVITDAYLQIGSGPQYLFIETNTALVSNGRLTTGYTYTISWSFSAPIGGNTSRGTSGTSGVSSNVISKTASYTINTGDQNIIADATTAAFTLTLPTAVGSTGSTFTVKRINSGTNNVTIGTTSSQYIDGSSTVVMRIPYQSLNFVSDGSNWYII